MVERIRKSGKMGPHQRGNPPAKAPLPKRRRRLDPEDREREILDGAVAFFAEVGFDGGLRDLATRLGINHQNVFRYFPTKDSANRAGVRGGLFAPMQKSMAPCCV